MEPGDFQDGMAPAADYAPVSLTTPWVLIVGVLLAFLILYLGYYFGRRRTEELVWRRRADACKSIHKAILDKARTAAAATRPNVMSTAQKLFDEITLRLGPVAIFGGPLGRLTKELGEALRGPVKPSKPAPKPVHAASVEHAGATPQDAATTAGAGPTQVNITVSTAANASSSAGASCSVCGHAPCACGKGDAPSIDQVDAIRKAVLDFCDFWNRPHTVEEMMAAQKALLTPAPDGHKGHGGGHGGGGHA
ncbi:MAG: hypothetical protein K1X35_07920 [Caulobacteraceae bacterium]|nr:hypothetical protein [Caulobacteraceae bacterium]